MKTSLSILGPSTIGYRQPTGVIYDDPPHKFDNEGALFFNLAGYTKPSPLLNGNSRQSIMREFWRLSVNANTEKNENPLDFLEHFRLVLSPEPDNQFDPNAIQVLVQPTTKNWYKYIVENYQASKLDLGYIPASISSLIKENLDFVRGVEVYKWEVTDPKKALFNLRIKIRYGEEKIHIPTENIRFTFLED